MLGFIENSINRVTKGIFRTIVTDNGKIQQCKFIIYLLVFNKLTYYESLPFYSFM